MSIKVVQTDIPGVIVLEPVVHRDSRGFFLETYHIEKYRDAGISGTFVQDNHSCSRKGTLRGLHYQLRNPQGKLVYVARGEIFDVAVDIRRGSPTFRRWVGVNLSAENRRQLYIPEGFAHGFCVISEAADVFYKCTDLYAPGDDYGILWSDASLAINWPVSAPLLSDKDAGNPLLADVPEENLPSI